MQEHFLTIDYVQLATYTETKINNAMNIPCSIVNVSFT